MFGILAQSNIPVASESLSANWGIIVNLVGISISATWLLVWPVILVLGFLVHGTYRNYFPKTKKN